MGIPASGPLPTGGQSELDRIRSTVAAYFPVYETRVGPQSLLLAVHADPRTLQERFDRLRRELWDQGYVPLLRRDSGEDFIEVIRRPKVGRSRIWINLLLLAGTFATTVFAGSLIWVTYVGGTALTATDFLNGALYFSAPVMTILGLHELAHYLMARRRHLDASLPYFMPVPPPFLFGTLGAFVSIREPFPDKKALFDIGASGPLAGFAASIPVAIAGLYLSAHAPVIPANYCGLTVLGTSYGSLLIGRPLFWDVLLLFAPKALVGTHPLALAGWVGIFVTAINLLPAGQLDGGHVFRALFGDRTRYVSYGVVVVLFGLGLFYTGWLFFAILILLLGLRHPPPLNDVSPLGGPRYALGAATLVILVAGFVVIPLALAPGAVALEGASASSPPVPPPGAMVAANLTVTLNNQDPVAHGYVFTASLTNVSVREPNGTTVFLTGTSLTSWEANSTWVFYLPGGGTPTQYGGSVSLPSSDFVTVKAASTVLIRLEFSNTELAKAAVIAFSVDQLCAPSSGGSASTLFYPTF